jgi:hypothetical protein
MNNYGENTGLSIIMFSLDGKEESQLDATLTVY